MRGSSIPLAVVSAALILFGAAGSTAIADNTAGKQPKTTVFFPGTEAVTPIQITLTWNTNLTDVDMHVFGPAGGHAYFADPAGIPGGVYLVDDVDGFGPENFNGPTAEEGMYWVTVDSFAGVTGANPTKATLTVVVNGATIFLQDYTFTSSDANAGNGMGVNSTSFWDAFHFTAVPPPESAMTGIPTLGTWGLILLISVVMIAATVIILRRHRRDRTIS